MKLTITIESTEDGLNFHRNADELGDEKLIGIDSGGAKRAFHEIIDRCNRVWKAERRLSQARKDASG